MLDDEEEFEVDEIQKKRLNNLIKKGEINDKSIGTNGKLNKTDPNKGNGFAQLKASPYSSPSQKDTPSNKRKKQSPYVNPQEKTVKSPPNVQQRSTGKQGFIVAIILFFTTNVSLYSHSPSPHS